MRAGRYSQPIRASAVVVSKMAMLLVLALVFIAATPTAGGLPPLAFGAAPMGASAGMAMHQSAGS